MSRAASSLVLAALCSSGCYRSHTYERPPRLHVPHDVNGDGYADVVVGAPDVHASGPGRAFVYLGSPTGVDTSPATRLTSPDATDSLFGASVAMAGDVDGDGYADVIIGSNRAAYVYVGGPSGVHPAPSSTLSGSGRSPSTPVAGIGDIDGDGFDDVAVGSGGAPDGCVQLYRGGATGVVASAPARGLCSGDPMRTADAFGSELSGAGDVDGDGFDDLVVCDDAFTSVSRAECSIYLGSATGLAATRAATLADPTGSSVVGSTVASAGDVNGDGFADVVVGASGPLGQAYLYLGNSSGIGTTPTEVLADPTFDEFATSVAGPGDLDGDGYDDVLIGAVPLFTGTGRVYVYRGSAAGLATPPAVILIGPDGVHGDFGRAVAGVGDVDDDGRPDIIVGEEQSGDGIARATIYRGSATDTVITTPATLLTDPDGMVPMSEFGTAVACFAASRSMRGT